MAQDFRGFPRVSKGKKKIGNCSGFLFCVSGFCLFLCGSRVFGFVVSVCRCVGLGFVFGLALFADFRGGASPPCAGALRTCAHAAVGVVSKIDWDWAWALVDSCAHAVLGAGAAESVVKIVVGPLGLICVRRGTPRETGWVGSGGASSA